MKVDWDRAANAAAQLSMFANAASYHAAAKDRKGTLHYAEEAQALAEELVALCTEKP